MRWGLDISIGGCSKPLMLLASFLICFGIKSMSEQIESEGSEMKPKGQYTIVAFGNSITATRSKVDQVFAQRLPGLLAKQGLKAKVINSGVGGSHTGRLVDNNRHRVRHALDRFQYDVLAYSPDLVVIGFGTNDAYIDSKVRGGPSRIPLQTYEDNLRHMINELHEVGARVILIAPNAHGKAQGEIQNERLIRYVQVVRKLSREHKTGLVDNFKLFKDYDKVSGQDMDDLMLDGTHPNDKGHGMIAESLANEILRIVAQVTSGH